MTGYRFLVTGCAGFIGSHMLERLIAEGYDAVGVDDLSTGSRKNIAGCEGKFAFIEGSVCDAATAARAVAGVSHVIHLASIPSVPRSIDDPGESLRASIVGTVTLLEAARRAGVRRVVQAASSSVYGNGAALPRTESMTPDPLSPYAVAKLAQEHYGKVFAVCYGLDTAALRYFNVFGPRQNPDSHYAPVIPKFITAILSGGRPTIFGDGGQSRDFTYVDNVVDANLLAALHPGPLGGKVMNVACGGRVTLNELVDRINALAGTAARPEYAPGRVGEVRHSQADISAISAVLNYSPNVPFDEGLRRSVAYYTEATCDFGFVNL